MLLLVADHISRSLYRLQVWKVENVKWSIFRLKLALSPTSTLSISSANIRSGMYYQNYASASQRDAQGYLWTNHATSEPNATRYVIGTGATDSYAKGHGRSFRAEHYTRNPSTSSTQRRRTCYRNTNSCSRRLPILAYSDTLQSRFGIQDCPCLVRISRSLYRFKG